MINVEDLAKADKLFDDRYKLLRPLSTDGGTADVWLAIDTNTIDASFDSEELDTEVNRDENTGMKVAIKIYRPKNALDIEGEQRFRDEFKIVYECHHENLIQPTSFAIFEEIPYLVLPYCKYGSSEQLIGKKLSEDDIWKYILDVASGLHRLHTNEPTPIIHQDIKPANVLIDNRKNYAITDFGISSSSGGVHGYYYDDENSGTFAYMAPERFQEDAEPMAQSDIWAFGATLCEILTGKVPFGENGGSNQIGNNYPMPQISGVSSDIQRLIHACLSKEPGDRPSAAEIKAAAMAKQYPVRSHKSLYGLLAAVAMLLVLFIVYISWPKRVSQYPLTTPTNSEIFDSAYAYIQSDDPEFFMQGINLMDSLSKLDYVPAMYQMAYTYGWYKDSESLRRKQMLEIELYSGEVVAEFAYLPADDKYSNRAKDLFLRICELRDSTQAKINSEAAYRLGCYYINPNPFFLPDKLKGRDYLRESRKWAVIANDTFLINKIDLSINKPDLQLNQNK